MPTGCATLTSRTPKGVHRLDPWPPVPTFVASSEPVPRGRPGESVREAPEHPSGAFVCPGKVAGRSAVRPGGAVPAALLQPAVEDRVVQVDVTQRRPQQLQ